MRGGRFDRKTDVLTTDIPITLPCFVEFKYDGEMAVLHTTNGQGPMLVNKHGTARNDCPITEQFRMLNSPNTVVIGELHAESGKANDLYKLLSMKEDDRLRFTMFDILSIDGQDTHAMPLSHRKDLINVLANNLWQSNGHIYTPSEHVLLPVMRYCETQEDILDAIQDAGLNDYEGVVIKQADGPYVNGNNWIKVKFRQTWDVEVSAIDPTLERVEFFMPNGKHTCGVKVLNKHKAGLKVGDIIEIEHQGVIDRAVRHPVFVRHRLDKSVPSFV